MFRNAFFINENQQQHFNIYITVYYIYHQEFSFFLEIFKNTPDKHRYFYYYIFSILSTYRQISQFHVEYSQKSFLYASGA